MSLTLRLLLLLACSPVCLQAVEERRVVVVAMMKAASHGMDEEWHMWRYPGHKPTRKDAQGRHDIASVMYPLIGPYDVSDPHYQEHVIQTLRMIGVDTISLWWPGAETKLDYSMANGKAQSLRELRVSFARRLAGTGIQACLRGGYDHEIDLTEATTMLGDATWRHENRPVIMWFTPPNESLISRDRLGAWKAAQSPSPWILHVLLDATDSRYRPAPWADATYGWIGRIRGKGAVYESGDFGNADAHYGHLVRSEQATGINAILESQAIAALGLTQHIAAVSPGFDDRAVGAWGQKTNDGKRSLTGVERSPGNMHRGTQTYALRWEQVLKDQKATTVMIPTWDDWNEGSQIEPSVEDGIACLEVTRHAIARFKALPASISGDVSLFLPTHLYRLRKAAAKKAEMSSVLDALSRELIQANTPTEFEAIEGKVNDLISTHHPEVSIDKTRFWPPDSEP